MSTRFANESIEELTMKQTANRRFVRNWLYIIFLLLVAIVLVGGATRITGSGLSITEWKPVYGILPPIGEVQWQREFEKYQQITQYQRTNHGMTLIQFKHIFWWEWAHRLLARTVGFAVFLPLIFFWATDRLESYIKWRLLGILALGVAEGIVGWWMVASGLGDSQLTNVSQYRLAVHLVMACVIIIAVLALARRLVEYTEKPAQRSVQRFAGWLVVLVLIQIYLGALVAGLHTVYNIWPLMDGPLIPDGLLYMQPAWVNFFENAMTVQFVHRFFAYVLLAATIFHTLNVRKIMSKTAHSRRTILLFFLILIQAIIGIITLLMKTPIICGLIHQGFALMVLSFAVIHWVGTKGVVSDRRPSLC
ncbi:MAG: Heme A synthase [Candidatus Tokpelaia sp. JSC189]|nr:MAG: Heme A synthase [Candidatus Tokpelaia sp. JSC189]